MGLPGTGQASLEAQLGRSSCCRTYSGGKHCSARGFRRADRFCCCISEEVVPTVHNRSYSDPCHIWKMAYGYSTRRPANIGSDFPLATVGLGVIGPQAKVQRRFCLPYTLVGLEGARTHYSRRPRPPSQSSKMVLVSVHCGGAEGIRTPDPLNAIEVLSQLSYSPT